MPNSEELREQLLRERRDYNSRRSIFPPSPNPIVGLYESHIEEEEDLLEEENERKEDISLKPPREMVKIDGEDREVSLSIAKSRCVNIDNIWYRIFPVVNKKLVSVINPPKDSPSGYVLRDSYEIVSDCYGDNCIKTDDIIKMYDGKYVNKNNYNVVTVVGRGYGLYKFNAISYNNNFYAINDKDVVKIRVKKNLFSNYPSEQWRYYKHRNEVVPINNNTKLSGFFAAKKDVVTCYRTKDEFFVDDCYLLPLYNGENIYINKEIAAKVDIKPVLLDIVFHDSFRYYHKYAVNANLDKNLVWSKRLNSYVVRGSRLKLSKKNSALKARYGTKKITDDFKSSGFGASSMEINNMENIHEELLTNNAFVLQGDINGGEIYYQPEDIFRRQIYSQTLSKVGGIDYTFGIEHETCVGIVPDYELATYGLSKIGDGSTRVVKDERFHPRNVVHFEYVTGVLHGNIGVGRVYDYLPRIAAHTLFNRKCSTHFHIGGQKEGDGFRSTSTPSFNRMFSALAIKLGIQIESSLADILPSYRNPLTNYYCSSIRGFKDYPIENKEQIDSLIANYVFQTDELNRDFNSKSSLGKWNRGRYKWLNLTNCNSTNGRHRNSSFQTIEFRIFPATNNPENIHLWLLICLGFVWFVENRPKLIRDGNVTLQSMMMEAYGDKPIYSFIKRKML